MGCRAEHCGVLMLHFTQILYLKTAKVTMPDYIQIQLSVKVQTLFSFLIQWKLSTNIWVSFARTGIGPQLGAVHILCDSFLGL